MWLASPGANLNVMREASLSMLVPLSHSNIRVDGIAHPHSSI